MISKTSSTFSQKVCALAKSIPQGRVTTYGLLTAAAGGHPMLSRMITSILSKDPETDLIPFHRIVYSDGRVWLEPKHHQHRLKLYAQEGIRLDSKNRIIDFEKLLFMFK